MKKYLLLTVCLGVVSAAPGLGAQTQTLSIYSARHYPSDAALYQGFTDATGIAIKRVDADDAGILARLKAEGAASPADVILLVDAARLHRGDEQGLFLPIASERLNQAIAPHLRAQPDANGKTTWFGFSTRARVIVYDKARVKPEDVDSYEKLAMPVNKGRICIRSGSHPYNLSLFGALMEHWGATATEQWLKGVVANLARSPKGGDTDQIRGVAAGECAVAVTNSYYLARLMRSDKPADREIVNKVGVVFPNQGSWGTHMNVAGGAVARHAPHPDAAIRFLEYLATPEAQIHFADGNNEWPAARGISFSNPALQAMSPKGFKSETLPISQVGKNQARIQEMLDRVGFK
ncbi:MAG: Fe(3+) ABC transporter substrate-binding protein [Rhodoferax sp.]